MEYLLDNRTEMLVAVLVTLVGGMIRGFSGFGPALVMAPVLSFLIGPMQAIAMIILVNLSATMLQLPGVFHKVQWREMIPLGVAKSLTIPIGTYILMITEPNLMRQVISCFVVLAAITIWCGWRYTGPRGIKASMSVGAFAGLITGSTTLGGPPVALYMLSGPYTADVVRASLIGVFATIQVSSVSSLAVAGLIDEETLWRVAVATPVFLCGLWIGGLLFSRVDERLYRRVILSFMIVVSTAILIF